MNWNQHFQAALAQQHNRQAYRSRRVRRAGIRPPFLESGGVYYVNFAGNDYLGLSHHENIIAAWQQALAQYGCGSGGSPLVSGHTDAHEALENQLADWLGYDRALLFASGFAANQALLLGLLDKHSVLLADKYCHASMQEAATLSPAVFRRFPHQNHQMLAGRLAEYSGRRIIVASEGVFSMDGDCADLPRLAALCRPHQALLLIDDAHGIGVLGDEGKGSAAAAGVQPDVLIITFGKALGSMGAAVLCNRITAEYLTQTARHLIYSTAIPPAQAAALTAAFTYIRTADDLRSRLQHNIALFQTALHHYNLAERLLPSHTPIQPFICGSNETALALAAKLRKQGLYVPAIRPPTVPAGQARLRITLSAAHEESHIMRLAESLYHAI
ncbi:8-amino-7-oxononanoate synthase [Uruburuella testudinis]|uniref:8-amino-7-oxononanoate synthase n=1 Tax=Uruburuella testudinis TaxID=1282863 RepID=A0ABY4DQN8_9NEIS|nr:8-amino-7-oxononanoate synthase [Uruburuella testudinis]UOO81044.1 8-amino-7-oxononanoate synthase [Uruburuella testudinis]